MPSRNRCPRLISFLLLGLSLAGNDANGQLPPAPASIHATGQHELKLEPQKLRLTLNIRAEGVDAKSAIEALIEHKKRVKNELLAMKAEEASIDFGAAQLTSGIPGMSAEMAPYAARMMAQVAGASNTDPSQVPTVFTAVCLVDAEWPLPTTDADALAMLPETLKQQVKERDLIGEKNKAQFDESQQEKLEELRAAIQENSGYYSSDDEDSPVMVLFVAKIDDISRNKATKAAYDQAVARAEMLASVSGHQIGNLVSLRSTDFPSELIGDLDSYQAVYRSFADSQSNDEPSDESRSASPDGLKLHVNVDVQFSLAK